MRSAFRGRVFRMRGNHPDMSKRIFKSPGTIAIKLVRDGNKDLGAGGNSLFKESIDILTIHMHLTGEPPRVFGLTLP